MITLSVLPSGVALAVTVNHWVRIAIVVAIISITNVLAYHWLFGLGISQRVYMRDLMFSVIQMDARLKGGERTLNELIEAGFKRDVDTQVYENYLHPGTKELLGKSKFSTDRELALAITQRLGQADGSVCGLEALGETVFDTRRGKGCCSDYSKSFLFYANYLGLPAREVSLFNHTTVEYLNRQTNEWQWLDPYNRVEILDASEAPMSMFKIRNSSRFEALKFRQLPSTGTQIDPRTYAGYSVVHMGTVLYRKGSNFMEVENWDIVMRGWGFTKSVRQVVTLVAGPRPEWLMLTTHADYFYYRTLRSALWLILGFILLANVMAVIWVSFGLRGDRSYINFDKKI